MTLAPRCIRAATAALVLTMAPAALAAQQSAAAASAGQPAPPVQAAAARPPARPADVESIDAIMKAVYDVISGGKGVERDWDRFRSLMAPNARLVPTGKRPDGTRVLRNWSVEEYIAQAGPGLMRNGFFERELGRKVERYGNVVHLMSAYDSKYTPEDAQPFQRGVNSFQLWNDGTRWYVVSIFWEAESPENPIPAELLKRP